FAALWPMSLALCVQFFVGRYVDRGRHFSGLELVWRTVVVGLVASVGVFVLPIPATVFGMGSDTIRGVLYAAELVAVTVVAIPILFKQWSRLRAGTSDVPAYSNDFVRIYGVVYIAVMGVLWVTALPAFFGAVDGVTDNGDPVGNLWYTLACFAVAILSVAATFTVPRESEEAVEAAENAPGKVSHDLA
ncbi:MAG: hypothetical protein FWE39_03680, partial [Nocardiaceae bacterium]|nr:hypothetical protein [Nocardiaceae bacterium]